MCKLIITPHCKGYFDSRNLAGASGVPMASKATLDKYFTLGQTDHSGSRYLHKDSKTSSKDFPSDLHPQTLLDNCWMREILVVSPGNLSADLVNLSPDQRGKILRVPFSSVPAQFRSERGAFLLDPSEIIFSDAFVTIEGSASGFYPFFSGVDPKKPTFGTDGLFSVLSFSGDFPISPIFRRFHFENSRSTCSLICNDGGSRRLVLEYNEL